MTEKRPDAPCLEEQLRCAQEGLRLLAENVADHTLVMLDTQGRVSDWSGAAQRMMGYRAEDIVGRHFSLCYSDPDITRGVPQRALGIATVMGRFEDEGWRSRQDGTVFRARVVCAAIRDDAGELLGFAELTHCLPDFPNFPDFPRAGPVYARCSMEVVSLTKILLECCSMVEPQAQQRGVQLRFSRVDTPCAIRADRQHVKQILLSLLSSTIDRNPVGASVQVECSASAPQRMRVSVRHSGAGPGPQNSLDGSLALVRNLVERMGGSAGAYNAMAEGSVAWIDLVVATAPQPGTDDAELFVLTQPPIPNI